VIFWSELLRPNVRNKMTRTRPFSTASAVIRSFFDKKV
jgi:hypothetical protein